MADTLTLAGLAALSAILLAFAWLLDRPPIVQTRQRTETLEHDAEQMAGSLTPGMAPTFHLIVTPADQEQWSREGLILLAIADANQQLIDRHGMAEAVIRSKQN